MPRFTRGHLPVKYKRSPICILGPDMDGDSRVGEELSDSLLENQ